jgi:hypothetical protein
VSQSVGLLTISRSLQTTLHTSDKSIKLFDSLFSHLEIGHQTIGFSLALTWHL